MLTYVLIPILLLPLMFLSSAVESIFSPDELNEMGISLENPRLAEASAH